MSISQHEQVLLERGRGQIVPGLAASADSLYRIASLTKPVTASAVLISDQAGRLSRNDKIAKYFSYAEPAPTIDELVKHIPGLSNYTDTQAYQSGNTDPHEPGTPLVARPALGRHSAVSVQQLALRISGRGASAGERASI